MSIRSQEALDYHSDPPKGKIEIAITKPVNTARQLSLAYTPGVAEPCLQIHADRERVYDYTGKGNLVAVVTNGTAVLGLGDIGPEAGKPVMEGKAVLFKKFADIDVFDIEVGTKDPDELIRVVKALEPTFGGINLEDIKAPECFYIERELRRQMNIPVFHDDQHGTAIISGAAFVNACGLAGKDPAQARIVVSGAGAAAIACMDLYVRLGARPENVWLVDTKGVVHTERTEGMNEYKRRYAQRTNRRTLAEALDGADVLVGLSVGGLVTPGMIERMAERPIIFAMANPTPEIGYQEARSARPDVLMATGRSDFPNQINNVLGFPSVFRGALDVRAREINTEMLIAAANALADLARQEVPESVAAAYGGTRFRFGPEYIIPKPFDPRVLLRVAPAVAEAAMVSGAAKRPVSVPVYAAKLQSHLGRRHEVMRVIYSKAKADPKRIVFPEGTEERILRAAQTCVDEGIAHPILLGPPELIQGTARDLGIDLHGIEILDPTSSKDGHRQADRYAQMLWERRRRRGITKEQAEHLLRQRTPFGLMMVEAGDADGCVDGQSKHYPEVLRPALQIIGRGGRTGVDIVCGMYVVILKHEVKFFADATVNIHPSAAHLSQIAELTADACSWFDISPKVALLSYSNFGSAENEDTRRVAQAAALLKERRPDLSVDGEMQADTALDAGLREAYFPWTDLKEDANVLIFPDLASGNVAYKLMAKLGGAETVGPVLLGMRKPVNVLARGCDVSSIVNIAALTCVRAQGGTPL